VRSWRRLMYMRRGVARKRKRQRPQGDAGAWRF